MIWGAERADNSCEVPGRSYIVVEVSHWHPECRSFRLGTRSASAAQFELATILQIAKGHSESQGNPADPEMAAGGKAIIGESA